MTGPIDDRQPPPHVHGLDEERAMGNGEPGGEATRSSPAGSVLAVLYKQHDELRDLLSQVADADQGTQRQAAFDSLRELLAAHEAAEEIVLRPVSVQIMNRDLVVARNHEERRIVHLLADLERLSARGSEFDERFPELQQALLEHLSVEEAAEFPAVRTQVDAHEQDVMGRWIRRACQRGPTHAHPGPAGSPTVQRAVGPFVALADRARDHFARTRKDG